MNDTLPRRVPARPSLKDRFRERLLVRALREIGPLSVEQITVPGSPITMEIARPGGDADCDRPYWAEIWPSSVVLAGVIGRESSRIRGRRALELGPGIGLVAVAALQAGADLVIADSAPVALLLCNHNARQQAGIVPRAIHVNWRHPTQELYDSAGPGFDIVLASDILYEDVDVKPLARLMERMLTPGGELWVAEPGRDPAQQLVELLRERGWSGISEECDSAWPDPHEGTLGLVTVHRLIRPTSSPARVARDSS